MQASAVAQGVGGVATLFIPFLEDFRETWRRSTVVNELGITFVDRKRRHNQITRPKVARMGGDIDTG